MITNVQLNSGAGGSSICRSRTHRNYQEDWIVAKRRFYWPPAKIKLWWTLSHQITKMLMKMGLKRFPSSASSWTRRRRWRRCPRVWAGSASRWPGRRGCSSKPSRWERKSETMLKAIRLYSYYVDLIWSFLGAELFWLSVAFAFAHWEHKITYFVYFR